MLDTSIQDVRFAIRLLRKSPLFALTAALSLAIGIGANATIFSVANAILLRALPGLADASELVDIGRTRREGEFDTVSFPNYKDLRDRTTSFSGIYAHQVEPTPMSLGGDGGAQRVYGALVTDNFFTVLGTRPHVGRVLQIGDDGAPGANAVAVLGHDLWTRRFASDAAIVGRQISINGYPFTVVGVAEPGFQGPTLLKADLWLPVSMLAQAMPDRSTSLFTSRAATWLFMGGRLKDGISLEQANAELSAVAAVLEQEHPRTNERMRFRAMPIAVVPGMTRTIAGFLGLLMAIVGVLLLVACVNLAGMLLARGAARTREIAVRVAIGARPGRIARQLLTETAVLFGIGALAGLTISNALTALLLRVLPQLPVPLALKITTDWRVVAFTAVVSLIAAVLCGMAPALQARRTDLVPALKSDALAGGGSRLRLRNVFVVGQVTLSLVLAITAGLFIRALGHAATVPTGFNAQHVDVVSLDLAMARHSPESGRVFVRELLQRIRAIPGVQSASAAADLPLDGGRMGFGRLRVPGAPGADAEGRIPADWNIVEPEFFRTLELRLLRGRDFDDRDTAAAPAVAIVNEAFARAAWPNTDPIGKTMLTERNVPVTVIGLMADAQLMAIGEPAAPYVLVPLAQRYEADTNLVVKTTGRSAIPEVRSLINTMNPNLPLIEALPLAEVTALGTIPQRIAGAVAGTLGIVGLLLAAIGIYGVTSYAVGRRTREVGIRLALGANEREVLRLFLRQGLVLTATGVVLGMILGALAARFMSGLLFGIDALDPMAFIVASALFATVALTATYIPARRAVHVDPMVALRNE